MSKSIMQNKNGKCYLCEMLGETQKTRVEEHHCFGGPNRKLSEHYGLKLYLCIEHHREGKFAVHRNANTAKVIHEDAQRAFMEHFPDKNFREIFGKNYLEE